jgi:hypothetical protein
MGLPKNFTEINQDNRQKALDDLKWIVLYYNYEMTDEYSEYLNTAYDWGHFPEPLGAFRVFVSDEERAMEMFNDHAESLINHNKIKSYKLSAKSCETGTCGVTAILN